MAVSCWCSMPCQPMHYLIFMVEFLNRFVSLRISVVNFRFDSAVLVFNLWILLHNSRVSNQNGVSRLCFIVEIYHSGRNPRYVAL